MGDVSILEVMEFLTTNPSHERRLSVSGFAGQEDGETSAMFLEAALISKANVVALCYVDIVAREFTSNVIRNGIMPTAVGLLNHSPSILADNYQAMLF